MLVHLKAPLEENESSYGVEHIFIGEIDRKGDVGETYREGDSVLELIGNDTGESYWVDAPFDLKIVNFKVNEDDENILPGSKLVSCMQHTFRDHENISPVDELARIIGYNNSTESTSLEERDLETKNDQSPTDRSSSLPILDIHQEVIVDEDAVNNDLDRSKENVIIGSESTEDKPFLLNFVRTITYCIAVLAMYFGIYNLFMIYDFYLILLFAPIPLFFGMAGIATILLPETNNNLLEWLGGLVTIPILVSSVIFSVYLLFFFEISAYGNKYYDDNFVGQIHYSNLEAHFRRFFPYNITTQEQIEFEKLLLEELNQW